MAITLEAIRAAGGIVHSDGNIFFRDISMLQGLAGAALAAVAPLPAVLEKIAQGWDGCMYDAPGETLDIGADIRAAAKRLLAEHPVAVEGPAREEIAALRAEHGITSSGRGIKEFEQVEAFVRAVLQRWGAAPALEAPAAPAQDMESEQCRCEPSDWSPPAGYDGDGSVAAMARAALAAAPQAPAAPSALAAQVIENLLQLARIVNVAVEDWGETKEDDSLHVIFHKEQADKLEEILEFFDALPDASPEEGVILSGPSRAARVLRAMAAPAAPAVDAPAKVLSQAARDVLAERRRQVEVEGWTSEHDDQHDEGEMCFAAAGYAAVASDNLQAISRDIDRDLTLDDNVYPPTNYPWPRSWEFKPCTPRRALVKAGALILAEIERIDRCSPAAAQAAAKGAA